MEPSRNNPDQLVDALNALLLHGTMSDGMRQEVIDVVANIPASSLRLRVTSAIYLVLTSSQYQVQR